MKRWFWWLALLPALALAQRPDEGDLFGAPQEATDAGTPAPDAGAPSTQGEESKPPADNRDADALTEGSIKDAFAHGEAVEDPLKIGLRFYLQAGFAGGYGKDVRDSRFSSPTLVDAYFDGRPNDRIRGMVVGRLSFDASAPSGTTRSTALRINPVDLSSALILAETYNPNVQLDQAWLNFDIEHHVFLTIGRQHVKWGTGRVWNPTDYLTPVRRDPLAFIDTRLGTSMVKVHVPWEAAAANFYGYGLLDVDGPASAFRQIGGAARAEFVVLKTAEVGLGALAQKGHQPRFALDVSTPLGPVDVYGEVAFKHGNDDPPRVRQCGMACGEHEVVISTPAVPPLPPLSVPTGYEAYYPEGWIPAATAGLEWTFAYAENKTATVGLEYFYNSNGYTDPAIYPALLLTGELSPFYMGKHYAALYATLFGPGSWDKASFFLFNLANLSDRSFVTRLNFTLQVLTYLTFEAFGAVHYGNPNGAFRLQMQVEPVPILLPNGLSLPAALWDAGVGLRVSL
ncbi:MAG TPA: hypothetical protein VIG99_16000 [Myxococcaceae bacterium]|jgi:hypothetical protein